MVSVNNWNHVLIIPAGLSNTDGLVELSGLSDTDPGSTIIKEMRSSAVGVITKLVPVFRYESISSPLPKDKVAIIKIDVEGAELEVVETLLPLIERDRPIIIIEILPTDSDNSQRSIRYEELKAAIRNLKYIPYRIIKTNSDSYECVLQINSIGTFTDPVLKDHILVPVEKVNEINAILTIAPTRTIHPTS